MKDYIQFNGRMTHWRELPSSHLYRVEREDQERAEERRKRQERWARTYAEQTMERAEERRARDPYGRARNCGGWAPLYGDLPQELELAEDYYLQDILKGNRI